MKNALQFKSRSEAENSPEYKSGRYARLLHNVKEDVYLLELDNSSRSRYDLIKLGNLR